MVLAREGQHSKKVPPALKAWHDKHEYAAQSLARDLPVHAPAKIEKVQAVLDGLREYERADGRRQSSSASLRVCARRRAHIAAGFQACL